MLRRLMAALIMSSLLMVAGATAATPAQAAACYGATCHGKDPQAYCNGDATTPVPGIWIGGASKLAYLELRYSHSCAAAWARISHAKPWAPKDAYAPTAWVIRNTDGATYSCTVPVGGTGCYTRMVNDNGPTSYARGLYDTGVQGIYANTASY